MVEEKYEGEGAESVPPSKDRVKQQHKNCEYGTHKLVE